LKFGFQEIQTPQLMNASLWKVSGHYEQYREDMYMFQDASGEEMGIKPMSCPAHIRLFMVGQKSYRDLPLRFAEFGVVHRNELSGTLHGLTRVRRITQDDGHIFCMPDQVHGEMERALKFVQEVYAELGFDEVLYMLSTRPENRVGDEALWDQAEAALEGALKGLNIPYQVNAGDGAFYGPKIDFKVRDAIGRLHQCATIQLDFQMPLRFGATYQNSQNSTDTPVMIHRAVLGSVERFLGIFIEHCAGHFPIGLAPVQCRVLSVIDEGKAFAQEVEDTLRQHGVRVESDLSNDKLGAKIRLAQMAKVPFMVIIGEKELQSKRLTVRYRDGQNLDFSSVLEFIQHLRTQSGVFWGLDVHQASDPLFS
jgi:threonyl-tRNA synthetase